MTRNLKALGLALIAVFATSAIAAQGALAVDHTFQITNATGGFLTGTNIKHSNGEGPSHVFKAGAATVSCSTTSFVGTVATDKADELIVTPKFSGCKLGETEVTVTNGEELIGEKKHCTYKYDSDTTANPGGTTAGESAPVTILCEKNIKGEEQKIFVTFPGCKVSIGSQGPLDGISYGNEGAEPTGVELTSHVFGIKYTTDKGIGCVPAGFSSSGQGSDGTTRSNMTVKGYKNAAHTEQVGVHVVTP